MHRNRNEIISIFVVKILNCKTYSQEKKMRIVNIMVKYAYLILKLNNFKAIIPKT